MIAALLTRCGELLFGRHQWRHHMAEHLGIQDRAVKRWCDGVMPVPRGVWQDLAQAVEEKQSELESVKREMLAQSDDKPRAIG